MEIFGIIAMLLGGCGVFLVGCKLLSDNMEKVAGRGIKKLFDKTSGNRFVGVGIGALSTAIVQSSGLTTVMVVGLVNASIMTLSQATSVIMGANIGTTVTGWLAVLGTVDYTAVFLIFALVGIFMAMFTKNQKVNTVGLILAGFGLIFVGLEIMSSQFAADEIKGVIADLLVKINNPFLLVGLGILLTALTQSSSVITSVIIVMAGNNILIGGGGNAVLFVILGTNIGSCVTALLSSIGTSVNARRASLIHLMFNVFGSVIFFIIFICVPQFMAVTFESWFPGNAPVQIALFHTSFNVICTCLFIGFVKIFVFISMKLIKDKKAEQSAQKVTYLDKRLLANPEIALDAVYKEVAMTLGSAMGIFDTALTNFEEVNLDKFPEIDTAVDKVNESFREITDYLIKISSQDINVTIESKISSLHHCLGDLVRVAELSQNFNSYTRRRDRDNLNFSDKVVTDLEEFKKVIFNQYNNVIEVLLNKNWAVMEDIDKIEQEVDDLRRKLVSDHIKRLNAGECRAESSSVFVNLVNNIERIGDHLHALAHNLESTSISARNFKKNV